MKTCLHRLLPTAILSLSSLAQPLSAQTTELYKVPNTRNDPVAINIDESFTPFGNRPITDKTAEDGSVAIRDENGVIIWTNNRGRAVRIPNSSQAKTLFVSNSECVIWQNRYDGTYNARGSTTQIILYRRDENGAATASPTITINGTVMDTSPVSPGTYGFTLLAGVTFDSGSLESRQRFQSGVDSDGNPTYDTKDVNQWIDNILTLYRITWDGKLQTLRWLNYDVPKSSGNNIGGDALANGSDGSFFFTAFTALDLYDDSTIPSAENPNTDPDRGIFKSQQVGVWVITSQDGEGIQQVVSSGRLPTGAAHVTNSRLLIETQEGTNFRIRDFRKLTNGSISEATAFNLPAGERLLSVADYTRDGLPVRFYTIANGEKDIKLYNAEASADATTGYPTIGAVVSLPNKFLSGSAYVRNPRDSSLLLKMDGGSLAWIRGGATGLNTPQALPSSQQAMPLFVSATESVAWMNSGAPPVITPSGVSLPIAKISHFDSSLTVTDLTASSSTITSPIAGRYVALTPSLTPDAKDEGWFISTFIKSNDRAAVMRTYTLTTTSLSDADRDGLPDSVESKTNTFVSKTDTGTRPTSFDSDRDGLSDGQEVYPFAIIRGSFSWQQARDDAKNRGGRLAVIPDDETYQALKRLLGGTLVDGAWVAGSDEIIENKWLWYKDWKFTDPEVTEDVADGLSWEAGKPDNLDDADAMWLNPNFYFEDAPATRVLRYYIIEYFNSNPTKPNSDRDGLNDFDERVAGSYPNKADSDGDGLTDSAESTTEKTYPLVKDSDGDGLDDGTEVKGWLVGGKRYRSNPLLIDTDNDGFDDQAEKIAGTNPDESQSRPAVTDPTTDQEKALNKQVRLERTPADVSIPQPFAPFGARTEISRFGDDGSAMLVDVNGVLIWRDASGANRQIPNSELHIPLVVSNSEAIVWTNGFKDYAEYGDKENVKVAIYRADPATGALLAPVPVSLQGKEILPTAPITTTSQAYHIVTSDHGVAVQGENGIIFRIYRITYSGTVQLLGQITMITEETPENSVALTKVLGHGSDGSIIFAQDTISEGPIYTGPTVVDGVTLVGNTIDYRRQVFWVDGVRPSTVGSGIWERLYDDLKRRNINDEVPDFDFQRVVSTSRTQAVYEVVNANGVGEIFEARRNAFTGFLTSKDVKLAGASDLGRVLQVSTQTLEGDTRWFYALNKTNTLILVYKLTNAGLFLDYESDIPTGSTIDETATVANIDRENGAAVIVSDYSPNILWVHKSSASDSTKNATPISGTGGAMAKPLFVTKNELVLWNNDGAPVLPNGSLPPAIITHYWLKDPGTSNVPVSTSLSAKIDGTYVMSVPPFTSAPEIGVIPDQYEWPWLFTTVEKTGSATTRFRTYRLQNWNIFDEDGDGLGSREEEKFKTSPQNPDTDGDGVSDGFEVQPFRIVTGNFNFEEARLDAIAKGGWLARPNTKARLESITRQVRGLNTGMRLWIGGSDMDAPKGIGNQYEGKYRWVDASGRFFNTGVSPAAPVGANFTYTNWGKGQPSDVGNLDGVQLDANFTWSMASLAQRQSYILETKPTNPLVPDGPGDLDGDGLSDAMEFALKTNSYKADTDNDGLDDFTEAGVLFSNPLTGFLSGAPVTLAKASYEGLLYNEKSGLLGKISVNMAANGTFTGTYEIYSGFKSSIKGTLNKNNGLLVANSFAAKPTIGATTIALQKDSQTGRNHLHVRVNNPTFGLLYAKARPAATGFKPVRSRFTLEAPLSEEASGPIGTMVAVGSIAANGGTTSLQMYNPDGTTTSSSGRVLDGGVIALYAKSSGSTPTHVMANIKVNNVLNTRSNFDAQLRLLTNEYDQDRTLEGSFYTAPAPRTLPISSFNASNTANNAVFNWTDGELDKAYQVNSWRPAEISPPKTNYDKTVATFTTATGLMKVDYTRSDKARNLYQAKSTAYAVVNQRKNTVNGFYSRLNWEGGSFSVNPNSLKLTPPPIEPPPGPIPFPGSVTSISPASKSVGTVAATYNIKVTGVDNWKVSIDESPSWVSAEVVNDDDSVWADKLTGRDNATVKITLLANNDIEARTATINIGDKVHTLTQSSGAASKITLLSKIAVKKGESYTIRVEAQGLWKAISSVNWLIVKVANDNQYVDATSPNSTGSGSATITVQVQPNLTGLPRLNGIIDIGGLKHTVNQNSY
jgi:hypothetical protein